MVGTAHPSTTPERFDVTFRVSSRARRGAARAFHRPTWWIRRATGTTRLRLVISPFDVQLQPQQAVQTVRSFTLPGGAKPVGVVITRKGFDFPAAASLAMTTACSTSARWCGCRRRRPSSTKHVRLLGALCLDRGDKAGVRRSAHH
ncbi:MAG: hypothetical protein U0163_20400 [Gemmatimonadaceae bacterium]